MKKRIRNMLFLLLLAAATQCGAQTGKEDPSGKVERKEDRIDIEYNECLTKDSSSANICNCAFAAYNKWNDEMDAAYKKVMKSLRAQKDKDALKAAQAAWGTFRDAEFKAYDYMFNLPGTNWCSLRQDGRVEIVRARTLQLRSYEQAFKN